MLHYKKYNQQQKTLLCSPHSIRRRWVGSCPDSWVCKWWRWLAGTWSRGTGPPAGSCTRSGGRTAECPAQDCYQCCGSVIRIRGFVPLTNGSGYGSDSGSYYFNIQTVTFKMSTKKNFFLQSFPSLLGTYLLFEGTFTSFFRDKSQKEDTKQQELSFFLLFLLDDGSFNRLSIKEKGSKFLEQIGPSPIL